MMCRRLYAGILFSFALLGLPPRAWGGVKVFASAPAAALVAVLLACRDWRVALPAGLLLTFILTAVFLSN
jgi:hypothetical protein